MCLPRLGEVGKRKQTSHVFVSRTSMDPVSSSGFILVPVIDRGTRGLSGMVQSHPFHPSCSLSHSPSPDQRALLHLCSWSWSPGQDYIGWSIQVGLFVREYPTYSLVHLEIPSVQQKSPKNDRKLFFVGGKTVFIDFLYISLHFKFQAKGPSHRQSPAALAPFVLQGRWMRG